MSLTSQQNLNLPFKGKNGSIIIWTATHPNGDDASHYITSQGNVTKPLLGEPNVEVVLTATVTKGGVSINIATFNYQITSVAIVEIESASNMLY